MSSSTHILLAYLPSSSTKLGSCQFSLARKLYFQAGLAGSKSTTSLVKHQPPAVDRAPSGQASINEYTFARHEGEPTHQERMIRGVLYSAIDFTAQQARQRSETAPRRPCTGVTLTPLSLPQAYSGCTSRYSTASSPHSCMTWRFSVHIRGRRASVTRGNAQQRLRHYEIATVLQLNPP